MQKKLWVMMALLLVIPALMFTVSCQKKTVSMAQEQPAMEVKEEVVVVTAAPAKGSDMVMQEDVFFEFDKSTLTPMAQDNLMRKAEWLRANSDANVTIEGHCDERGTPEYNLALGDRRAESTKAYLVDLGINASRLSTVSYGEERPLDPASNQEAWAKNRRGHFVID
jgi:peptidoglycan-associated lipoprotein